MRIKARSVAPQTVTVQLAGRNMYLPTARAVEAGSYGALPVVTVDLDGDGLTDLLDLGQPGRAALHRGTKTGFADEPSESWSIPRFVHVVALPRVRTVVLVGQPRRGKTEIAWIGPTARTARR